MIPMTEPARIDPRTELTAFIDGVSRLTGIDFKRYQREALLRRVLPRMEIESLGSLGELLDKASRDRACMARLHSDLTLHVTSMFRDPSFFKLVRQQLGVLGTYPRSRLWVAGCSTGAEVYTYLILLKEAGLAEQCRVYATDVSAEVLRQACSGQLDIHLLPDYERCYQASGGTGRLMDYCQHHDGQLRLHPDLLKGVVFNVHNLLADASFNEFQFISCRNVIMYFDELGQRMSHELLHQSLAPFGHLGLGIGESLLHSPQQRDYQAVSGSEALYRRLR